MRAPEPARPALRLAAAFPHDAAQEEARAVDDLAAVGEAAERCRACGLWRHATQTVFGEGPPRADLFLVGEQPGDQEDLAGVPFVGPAGKLLDRAFAAADIDREQVYVTNAVKHFKFEPRGKRRLHKRPTAGETQACRWWLKRELELVRPRAVAALGATAVYGLFGKALPIGKNRGRPFALEGGLRAFITVHPSALLRIPDDDARREEFARFVADLKRAAGR